MKSEWIFSSASRFSLPLAWQVSEVFWECFKEIENTEVLSVRDEFHLTHLRYFLLKSYTKSKHQQFSVIKYKCVPRRGDSIVFAWAAQLDVCS